MTHRSREGVKRRAYQVNKGDCRVVQSDEKSEPEKGNKKKGEVKNESAN